MSYEYDYLDTKKFNNQIPIPRNKVIPLASPVKIRNTFIYAPLQVLYAMFWSTLKRPLEFMKRISQSHRNNITVMTGKNLAFWYKIFDSFYLVYIKKGNIVNGKQLLFVPLSLPLCGNCPRTKECTTSTLCYLSSELKSSNCSSPKVEMLGLNFFLHKL